jgi:hypothetical protein
MRSLFTRIRHLDKDSARTVFSLILPRCAAPARLTPAEAVCAAETVRTRAIERILVHLHSLTMSEQVI